MIIKKLTLSPFAGVSNREVVFHEGLNVIEGPNEAGKSTLVKALNLILFCPTNLTAVKESKSIKDYLPTAGGDTISVSLEFEQNGISYTLSKSWGATKSSKLQISGLGTLTKDDTVNDKIKELLVLNEATWKNVLFSHQAVLKDTISEINKSTDIKGPFTDLLGKAVTSAGGISPESFRASLEDIILEYYNNWDENLNLPNKGRGIDNKWQNKVGKILIAYYSLHDKKREIEVRDKYDKDYDQIIKEIQTNKPKINELKSWVEQHEPLIKDAQKRNQIQLELSTCILVNDKLREDTALWPKLVAKIEHATTYVQNIEKELKSLDEELQIAVKQEQAKLKKDKYAQLERIKGEIYSESKTLEQTLHIEEVDLESAMQTQRVISNCDTKLEAQKLRVSISPKITFSASIQNGTGAIVGHDFEVGNTLEEIVSGKFKMETDVFSLEVVSGQEDIGALISDRQKAVDLLSGVLSKYKVSDIDELGSLGKREKDQKLKIDQLNRTFKEILDNDTFDSLKQEMDELKGLSATRGAEMIRESIDTKKEIKTKSETELRLDQDKINELEEKYQSQDNLIENLGNKTSELKSLKSQLEKLKPMPANLTNAQEFIDDFEGRKKKFEELKEAENQFLNQKWKLDQQVPEKSSLELKEELALLEKEYKRQMEEGSAYRIILEKTNSILNSNNASVFESYHENTTRYFGSITNGRYNRVIMNGVIPEEITDGKLTLKQNLLSQGTQDALALSLRLSMADYYLKDDNGFLIMDDPLTDMDSSRQKNAANCINQFATEKQVILFTCHQTHADILGGNRLAL